jgi:hypothetical protein
MAPPFVLFFAHCTHLTAIQIAPAMSTAEAKVQTSGAKFCTRLTSAADATFLCAN